MVYLFEWGAFAELLRILLRESEDDDDDDLSIYSFNTLLFCVVFNLITFLFEF